MQSQQLSSYKNFPLSINSRTDRNECFSKHLKVNIRAHHQNFQISTSNPISLRKALYDCSLDNGLSWRMSCKVILSPAKHRVHRSVSNRSANPAFPPARTISIGLLPHLVHEDPTLFSTERTSGRSASARWLHVATGTFSQKAVLPS